MNVRTLFIIMGGLCTLTMSGAEPADSTLNEVVVTGTRNAARENQLPMTLSVIDRKTLTANERPNIQPTLMEQVPGLMLSSRGVMGYGVSTGAAGGIMMRGLSSGTGQVMVLIDGNPQYQGVFGHSIADSYQTMMVERVEVVRGPSSVLYGSNAMGGVINIVTRGADALPVNEHGVGSKTSVQLSGGSYATMNAEVNEQLKVGRFTATIASQYGHSHNHRPNMGFEQYGGYVKLGYTLNDHWNVDGTLDMTHFNASNPGTVSEPKLENDQHITRGSASLMVQNKYRRTTGAVSLYDNFGRHKINDGFLANSESAQPQTDLFRSRDALMGVSAYQTFFLPAIKDEHHGSLTIGLDYQDIYGKAWYTDRKTGEKVVTPKRLKQSAHSHENEIAAYVDLKQDFTSWLGADMGIRYDHHSVAGDEWIPQFGLVFRPCKDGALRAIVSKGFRNPTTKEMYLYGTANHDSLEAERMMNYELSWKHTVAQGKLSYGANIFYAKGDNLIQTIASRNVNSGWFENIGAEAELTWNINKHWLLTTNHSYIHTDTPLVGVPAYKGYLGTTMNYGKWSLTAGVQQIADLCTSTTKNAQSGRTEAKDKETFTLLNATVGYQVCHEVRIWVKGDNLLAQSYEINAGYPMPRATVMAGVNVVF